MEHWNKLYKKGINFCGKKEKKYTIKKKILKKSLKIKKEKDLLSKQPFIKKKSTL